MYFVHFMLGVWDVNAYTLWKTISFKCPTFLTFLHLTSRFSATHKLVCTFSPFQLQHSLHLPLPHMTHSLSSAMQHTLPERLLICNAADGCTHTCSRPQDTERCMCGRWKSAVEERTNGVKNLLSPGPTHPPLVSWVWGEPAHLLLSIHRPWTQPASCLSSPLRIYMHA